MLYRFDVLKYTGMTEAAGFCPYCVVDDDGYYYLDDEMKVHWPSSGKVPLPAPPYYTPVESEVVKRINSKYK